MVFFFSFQVQRTLVALVLLHGTRKNGRHGVENVPFAAIIDLLEFPPGRAAKTRRIARAERNVWYFRVLVFGHGNAEFNET